MTERNCCSSLHEYYFVVSILLLYPCIFFLLNETNDNIDFEIFISNAHKTFIIIINGVRVSTILQISEYY